MWYYAGGVLKLAHVWLSGAKFWVRKMFQNTCRANLAGIVCCLSCLFWNLPKKITHVNDFLSCGACGGDSSRHYRMFSMAASVCLEAIVAAARRYIFFFALHDALRHGPYRLVVRRRAVAATTLVRLLVGTFASCARGSDSRGHALSH